MVIWLLRVLGFVWIWLMYFNLCESMNVFLLCGGVVLFMLVVWVE